MLGRPAAKAGEPEGAKKRLDGLSREVFLLTGGVTPAPIVPTVRGPVGEKRPTSKVRWARKRFTSSARKDGAIFEHWGKVGDTTDDYEFARFNKAVKMVTYSDAEYREHLTGLQPPNSKSSAAAAGAGHPPIATWSKEETDELFRLCAKFDLRFIVIHDRWPVPGGVGKKGRAVDELKDRYYSVAKKLIEVRSRARTNPPVGALQKHCQAIVANPFDIEYERERKAQIERQMARSKMELREEEEVVREARRIEANRKRIAKEKQRLQKLMATAGDIQNVGPKGPPPLSTTDPASMALAASGGGSGAEQLGEHLVVPSKLFPHRKQQIGAFARSNLIYTPVTQSTRIVKRIEAVLEELGVGLRPLATARIVDQFDFLRLEIGAYLELQRTVMRKEEETHNLRVRLAKLKGEPIPSPPPGVTLSHKKRKADDWEPPLGISGLGPTVAAAQPAPEPPSEGGPPSRKRRKH